MTSYCFGASIFQGSQKRNVVLYCQCVGVWLCVQGTNPLKPAAIPSTFLSLKIGLILKMLYWSVWYSLPLSHELCRDSGSVQEDWRNCICTNDNSQLASSRNKPEDCIAHRQLNKIFTRRCCNTVPKKCPFVSKFNAEFWWIWRISKSTKNLIAWGVYKTRLQTAAAFKWPHWAAVQPKDCTGKEKSTTRASRLGVV